MSAFLPEPALPAVADIERQLREQAAGLTLLLVEDEPINAEIACLLLDDVGLLADVAEDGEVAQARARERDYPLILMDIQMPRCDGFTASRRIRELPRHAATPIVAMTAHTRQEELDLSRQAGMNDFLAKPLSPETLYALLWRWLIAR